MPEKEFPTLAYEAAHTLERKGKDNEQVDILLREIEGGRLTAFDGASVSLLQEVLKEEGKMKVFSYLLDKFDDIFLWLGTHIGSKYAGYEVGKAVTKSELGKEYAKRKASEYLSRVLRLDIEEGILGKIKEEIQERLIQPIIDSFLAPLAGQVAVIPSAIGGYLGGSVLTGGTVELLRERKRSHGFERIAILIEASEQMIRDRKRKDNTQDPRDEIIAYHEAIIEDPKRLGHHLINEEWLQFVAAARKAKVDKLRELTRSPAIVAADKTKEGLTIQENLVETIIHAQERITQADQEMAIAILSQFDKELEKLDDPVEKYIKGNHRIFPKITRYSKAFVRGGVNATGVPLLFRMVKGTIKIGVRVMSGGFIKL